MLILWEIEGGFYVGVESLLTAFRDRKHIIWVIFANSSH